MQTTIEQGQERIPDPYVTKARFPLKINKITPMIQMNIEFNQKRIIFAMMMYLEKLIQYSYKQDVIEGEERKIEADGSTKFKLKVPGQRRGKTGQPMEPQILAPNLLVQSGSLVGVTQILDQGWTQKWNR
ncbi:MAG: hypothetical protein EZS28_027986 [Streblomastix strix]|uniref:Uncharacterized protein n=1 Tax=Streblomastix strix TaxID=222440 RepID=A0A5J4V1K5_9EUKA|nr:MAG: hypothetical protein EZS28_027986 [Streblomastix strix]